MSSSLEMATLKWGKHKVKSRTRMNIWRVVLVTKTVLVTRTEEPRGTSSHFTCLHTGGFLELRG